MSSIWKGQRVTLRGVEESDIDSYFFDGEHDDSDDQRDGDVVLFPLSRANMEARVAHLSKLDPTSDEFFLIIENEEGIAIGNINSHSASRRNGTFEYGVAIRRAYRKKGYAKEAISILLNFYFSELGFIKANSKVYGFNKNSIELQKKLGFKQEGQIRKSHYANGEYHDIYCFGITKDEFFSRI